MATKPPDQDPVAAITRLLSGLASGDDVFALTANTADLHPKNDTFPGQVFIGVAASALELAGFDRANPLHYEGLRETYLPECEFRGRENRKIQYAILTSTAVGAGLKPDLLEEVYWWRTDDFWEYALYAAVAMIRAGAKRRQISVVELVEELARHLNIELN